MKVYRRAEIETKSVLVSDVIAALYEIQTNTNGEIELVSINRNFGGVKTFDIVVEWKEDRDQEIASS